MKMTVLKKSNCGCNLRTGSLILLWLTLVGGWTLFLMFLFLLINLEQLLLYGIISPHFVTSFTIRTTYYLVLSFIAMIVSVLGIYGIHESKPKYLNGSYYFFCYVVVFLIIQTIMMFFAPFAYKILFGNFLFVKTSVDRGISIVGCLYGIVYSICFISVVKSFRDVLMKDVNSGKGEILCPAAKSNLHV